MQNTNHQYFALLAQPNGTIKRVCPKTIYKSSYQGIDMFVYQINIGEYHVVECSTGLPIAVSKISRNDALARSRHNINTKGVDGILKEIQVIKNAIDTMNIYEENDG